MMTKWKLITGVALVFILGVLSGSLGTHIYQRQWSERFWKDPAARRAIFLQRLTKELQLTAAQQKEVQEIIEEVDQKIQALRRQNRAEIKGIIDDSFTRMNEKLSPEQKEKLAELKAEHEQRIKDKGRKPPPP